MTTETVVGSSTAYLVLLSWQKCLYSRSFLGQAVYLAVKTGLTNLLFSTKETHNRFAPLASQLLQQTHLLQLRNDCPTPTTDVMLLGPRPKYTIYILFVAPVMVLSPPRLQR